MHKVTCIEDGITPWKNCEEIARLALLYLYLAGLDLQGQCGRRGLSQAHHCAPLVCRRSSGAQSSEIRREEREGGKGQERRKKGGKE